MDFYNYLPLADFLNQLIVQVTSLTFKGCLPLSDVLKQKMLETKKERGDVGLNSECISGTDRHYELDCLCR